MHIRSRPASARPCSTSSAAVTAFSGPISTVRCHEDNVVLKRHLGEPGAGRVLVVDGGGSLRRWSMRSETDVPVEFGGITFEPGATLYSDDDGVVVLDRGGV